MPVCAKERGLDVKSRFPGHHLIEESYLIDGKFMILGN
jgi:hypothetical protein